MRLARIATSARGARSAPPYATTPARFLSSTSTSSPARDEKNNPRMVGEDEFPTEKQARLARLEFDHGAHNYHPIPIVLSRGKGHLLFDVEGKPYMDFLSAFSAVNQGHCHPKIVAALTQQASTLTLTSRAFYNDVLGTFEKKLTKLFGYDKVLLMNSGAEAVEAALKIAKKWAYKVKGVEPNAARLVFMRQNFHGRTQMCISASDDPSSFEHYGPFVPNVDLVPFDDAPALEALLSKQAANTACVVLEPIQGEAGIIVPKPGYLSAVREICTRHDVLMVADEVQTGIGRTGTMVRCDSERARPDILVLGKALSGGFMPISCALADDPIMLAMEPGSHGSTFGGNALAASVGIAALDVILEERLVERSASLGQRFQSKLRATLPKRIATRGAGLLNAVIIPPGYSEALKKEATAWDVCLRLMHQHQILAKPTHRDIIRLAPPLVIPEQALDVCAEAMAESIRFIFGSRFE